jgi:hypothetical protein
MNDEAQRLLAMYRAEIDCGRGECELLEEMLKLPSMKRDTAAKIRALLGRSQYSPSAASKLALRAIREMDPAEVEAWLDLEAADRGEAQASYARSQLFARLARVLQPASGARAQKMAAILETARRVDAELPIAWEHREHGSMGSAEILLHRLLDAAADQDEIMKMLEAVLLVASDRALDAAEPTRQSEEKMLAEYQAEQKLAGKRKGPARAAGKPVAAALKGVA